MKVLKFFIPLLVVISLAACSNLQPERLEDENILLKVPIPGLGWTIRSGKQDRQSIELWTKKDESFRVTIEHRRPRLSPEQYMLQLDDTAQLTILAALKSKPLKAGQINHYPMILWETEATFNDGSKTCNLFLYIKGNDAGYLAHRRWNQAQVPEAEKQQWINYLSTITVCDNRYPEHQAPKLEPAWPGVYYNPQATNTVSK